MLDTIIKYTVYHTVCPKKLLQCTVLSIFRTPITLLKFFFCSYIEWFVISVIYLTKSSGHSIPLLLAPAEDWGALWAPSGPWGPTGGLLPLVGSKLLKVNYMSRLFGLFS